MSGMVRTFVQETERKTWILLKLHAAPAAVYTGKLLYNFLFLLILHLFTFFFYMLMMNLSIESFPYFLAVILLGAAGLASVTTLISAMIAQVDSKGALFAVQCIPQIVALFRILCNTAVTALIHGSEC